HVWDGFTIHALLKDASRRQLLLVISNIGQQKDRFTGAMRAWNEHIRRAGQPEFSHWCTKCHRRYDNDGTADRVCLLRHGLNDVCAVVDCNLSSYVGYRTCNNPEH
ncbi:hypothetical protein FKP32DRAFT_1531178, partial [Trametes sanguinea]